MTTIVSAFKSSKTIRAILKSGDEELVAQQDEALDCAIFDAVDLYTGANLDIPTNVTDQVKKDLEAEQDYLFASCREFVKEHYSSLAIEEIRDAFSMYASGKLKIEIKTFYGNFKVLHLGSILNAYSVFRKNVLGKYTETEALLESRKPDADREEKNKKAQEEIIQAYILLSKHFKETGDIESLESTISRFWGKILIESDIIKLTNELRTEIKLEAQAFVRKEIESETTDITAKSTERREARSIIAALEEGKKSEAFVDRWKARYCKLVVIKSILNQ